MHAVGVLHGLGPCRRHAQHSFPHDWMRRTLSCKYYAASRLVLEEAIRSYEPKKQLKAGDAK